MPTSRARALSRAAAVLALALTALFIVPAAALALAPPAPPSVAAGYGDSLVIKSDGTLWAWGVNGAGELGLGDTMPREVPTQVGTGTDWAQVAIGDTGFVLALKSDGTLWGWGNDQNGQLGRGTFGDQFDTPQRIGTAGDWAAIACGDEHALALKQDGTLWAWGSNWYGQLGLDPNTGDADPLSPSFVPVRVDAASTYKSIACGYAHSLAVKSDGTLWAWGTNAYGQLGRGTVDPGNNDAAHVDRVQVGTATDWTTVSAGFDTSFGLRTDGSLYAWGNNGSGNDWAGGELGDGTNVDRHAPVRVGTGTDWKAISGGSNMTAAVKSDGTLWAWGYNSYGELGITAIGAIKSPRQVGTRTDWRLASAGAYHLLALSTGDDFGSCGGDFWGQTGIGYALYRPLGEQVGDQTGWVSVDAGLGHTGGIRADGTLWMWGRNGYGELAQDTSQYGSVNTPLQVGSDTDWAAVSCGDNTDSGFTAAVKTGGTLWAWGANDTGQLGVGDKQERDTPTQVGAATDWKTVACSDGVGDVGRGLWGQGDFIDFTLGLRTDGSVWAWGDNSRGQLGQGDHTDSLTPEKIPALDGVTIRTIAAGDDYAMAISNEGSGAGKLYAWGDDTNGQLGRGTTTATSTPAQVGTATDWLTVACGSGRDGAHAAGIRQGSTPGRGTLWTWGDNGAGELGLGDHTARLVPTQVGTDSNWVAVSCGSSYGDDFVLALKADGTLWAFGGDYRGQLGKGDYISVATPVEVPSLSAPLGVTLPLPPLFSAMSCGADSFGILQGGTLWAWGDNEFGQLGLGDPTVNPLSGVFGLEDYTQTGADPDTTAPVVSETAATSSAGMLRAAGGVAVRWYKRPLTVKLTAWDGQSGSGVSRVQYSVNDGIGWKTGRSVTIRRQGVTYLKYRGLDRVRNASTTVRKAIGIDSTRPKPCAPKAASVARYGTALLTYKIGDVHGATEKVTFAVKNAAGRTLKSWSVSSVAANRALTAGFRCTLQKGAYRFVVSARDEVGLTQLKTASNRLVVN